MSIAGLHERLTQFGFNKEEAEIYIFITAMGPTPARVVARRFDINRMKAYRTLKDLEEKGFVHRIMGRPVRFVTQPIEGILNAQIEQTRDRLSTLENNHLRIIEDLERLSTVDATIEEEPRFRIYQGRQQVYELLATMCDRVKAEINIVTTPSDFLRLSLWGIDNRLIRLASSGRIVRLLTQIDDTVINEIENIQDHFEIRHLAMPSPLRFVTIDDGETLTSVAMDDSMSMTTQDDTGLWTNAASFTTAMNVFYDALWSVAPESHVVINTIRTGERPQEFVTIRSMDEYSRFFSSLISTAETSVDLMVNKIQDLPVPLSEIIQDAGERRIRVLTIVEESMSAELSRVMRLAEVRHNVTESKLTLLVVDGDESLLTTTGFESSIHAVWSNLEAYVETTTMIFEDYWVNSSPADTRYRELIIQENKSEITGIIQTFLEERHWKVTVPGKVKGNTGLEYVFDLYAENERKAIGLNLNLEEDAFNKIFELSARKMDLEDVNLILGSIKPLEEEIIRLASLYGISLIQADDAVSLTEKILEE
ncbi:MAG: hypothetical protein NWE89_17035 [Candidatus Bathyarchaeota archaeon]|nr:hypothetical protein [Candidatus Bathyarchaeota archaeon]